MNSSRDVFRLFVALLCVAGASCSDDDKPVGSADGDMDARVDANVDDDAGHDDAGRDAGHAEPVQPSAGVFVVEATIDTWWANEDFTYLVPIMSPGRGNAKTYFVLYLAAADSDLHFTGEAQLCGIQFPPFIHDAVCEAYAIDVAPDAWDHVTRVPIHGAWNVPDATDVHGVTSVTIAPWIAVAGITLPSDDATWPDFSQYADHEYPDADMDDFPGITATTRTGGEYEWADYFRHNPDYGCFSGPRPYAHLPYAYLDEPGFTQRATRLLIGVRAGLAGTFNVSRDEQEFAGTGSASHLNLRFGDCYDLHDSQCGGHNLAFVNENIPVYRLLDLGESPPEIVAGKSFGDARELFGGGWGADVSKGRGTQLRVRRMGNLNTNVNCTQAQAAFQ